MTKPTNAARSAIRALVIGAALLSPLRAGAQNFLMNIKEGSNVSRFIQDPNAHVWTFPSSSNAFIRSQALWSVSTEVNRKFIQFGQIQVCDCIKLAPPSDSKKAMIPGFPL